MNLFLFFIYMRKQRYSLLLLHRLPYLGLKHFVENPENAYHLNLFYDKINLERCPFWSIRIRVSRKLISECEDLHSNLMLGWARFISLKKFDKDFSPSVQMRKMSSLNLQ